MMGGGGEIIIINDFVLPCRVYQYNYVHEIV